MLILFWCEIILSFVWNNVSFLSVLNFRWGRAAETKEKKRECFQFFQLSLMVGFHLPNCFPRWIPATEIWLPQYFSSKSWDISLINVHSGKCISFTRKCKIRNSLHFLFNAFTPCLNTFTCIRESYLKVQWDKFIF